MRPSAEIGRNSRKQRGMSCCPQIPSLISLWISRYGTGARAQPFCQLRPPSPPRDVAHRNGNGLLLSNHHDEPLPSGDASVEEIALQHGVMLSQHWDYHGGIFRPLAFVNGRRVGRHQHIEFAESVLDGTAVEANSNFPRIDVDIVDGA